MDALEQYIHDHTSPEEELLHELDREANLRVVQPRMLSGHIQGRLLEMLVRMLRPRRILEIGTFTGYSALSMAAGLEEGGELHTIEVEDELEELKTVKRKEVAEKIKVARGFGDLSENSEYDEAKNEQGKLYSRIAELDEILSNYTLIEEQENHMDMVHVGNNVVVKDLEFDETLHYQIVGSQEADPMNGRISEDSPFGRALLGKKAGEEVVVEAPAGNIRYQIVEIQR